jgi:hypothetical protein
MSNDHVHPIFRGLLADLAAGRQWRGSSEDMATSLAAEAARPFRFDPAAPVSPLAARLLAASNALHNHPSDGVPPAEPFTSRHGRKP